jgi:glycopeptide antibiotics resistance protein
MEKLHSFFSTIMENILLFFPLGFVINQKEPQFAALFD